MGSKTLFNAVFIRPEQVVRFLLCSGEGLLHACISSKALKHKYKYALSTYLHCVSRRSQFLALLCIFPEPTAGSAVPGVSPGQPGARATNFVLAEFKVVARDR